MAVRNNVWILNPEFTWSHFKCDQAIGYQYLSSNPESEIELIFGVKFLICYTDVIHK